MKKRILGFVLCLIMVLSLLPVDTFAEVFNGNLSGNGNKDGLNWNMRLDENGVLYWDNATPAPHEIQLYLNGKAAGGNMNATGTSWDIKSYMDSNRRESGQYSLQIDSNSNQQSERVIYYYTSPLSKLPAPTNLRWGGTDGKTAMWDAVPGAAKYEIYTYGANGKELNHGRSTDTTWYMGVLAADGMWFTVKAVGDSTHRDSEIAEGPKYADKFLGIWIGSTPVTTANRFDVLNDGGSVMFLPNGEAYNEDLHGDTLVLNNLNLTNPTYHTNADGHRAMLTIANDIAVVLIGENIIHPPKNGEIFGEDDLGSLDGVYIGQNMYVSFYGSGRLDVSVSRNNSALFSDNSTVMLNDNVTMRLSGKYGFNSAFSGIEVPWLELYDNSKLYAYGLRDDNDRDGLAINCPNITLGDNAYLYAEYEWNQQAVDTWDSNYKELSSTVLTIRGIRNQIGMVNTEWETLNSINTGSADDEGKFRALEIQAGKPSVLLGDVNNDGVVTDADAVYLLYYTFFGDGEYPVNQPCDFNGDGAVTDADAVYLLYYTFFGAEEYPLH